MTNTVDQILNPLLTVPFLGNFHCNLEGACYFFCMLFLFVCSIKCATGGAFYAADKQKKRAEKVNKHVIFDASSKKRRVGVKGLTAFNNL